MPVGGEFFSASVQTGPGSHRANLHDRYRVFLPGGFSGRSVLLTPSSPLVLWNYRYKQYIVKHNSINDFIKVYFLHCFVQRHVSALVMSHLQVDYFSFLFTTGAITHCGFVICSPLAGL